MQLMEERMNAIEQKNDGYWRFVKTYLMQRMERME
jgi:hypothetical protein